MRTCYANACALDSSHEAVEAFFGIDRELTRRIVFAPAMAKRLAAALAKVVRDYEARYGALTLDET